MIAGVTVLLAGSGGELPLLPQIVRAYLHTTEGQEQAERMAVGWAEYRPDDLVMVTHDDERLPPHCPMGHRQVELPDGTAAHVDPRDTRDHGRLWP